MRFGPPAHQYKKNARLNLQQCSNEASVFCLADSRVSASGDCPFETAGEEPLRSIELDPMLRRGV